MALASGTRLGSYEVVAAIGAGGMGEVYRARDTKLGRDVAIKVLPEAFAHDAERLSRFQREAKMLAALNHPNIATIHGLEQSGSTNYLVMELVPGETLAERVKRDGAVPVEEALAIARQVAEALDRGDGRDDQDRCEEGCEVPRGQGRERRDCAAESEESEGIGGQKTG